MVRSTLAKGFGSTESYFVMVLLKHRFRVHRIHVSAYAANLFSIPFSMLGLAALMQSRWLTESRAQTHVTAYIYIYIYIYVYVLFIDLR